MGLGLAALGRPGYINLGHDEDIGENKSVEGLETRAHAVLDAAWQAGIRYFDAARSYGRAEAFLAKWLAARRVKTDEVVVASKWGYTYTADWQVQAQEHEVKEHSLALLKRQLKQSRERLGAYLALYQIHSATLESGVLENEKVLDELARLKRGGLLIGLTLSGDRQSETLAQAMRIERDGRRLFDSVQATWNVLEPSAGDTLAAAHQAGMRVIVKEALANGRLTARNVKPHFAEKRALLERMANQLGADLDAVAIAAALAQPWADVVLSGAARVEHLQSNLKALEIKLSGKQLGQLQALAEPREQYWARRSQLEWN